MTPRTYEQMMMDGAMAMEDVYRERLEAQFGERDIVDLTREQVATVLDP